MVDSYYGGRTRVWLNRTLQQMAATAAAATAAAPEEAAGAGTADGDGSRDATAGGAGAYRAVPGYDCNYHDLGKHPGKTVAQLEALCSAQPRCIGFNYPHGIFKVGPYFISLVLPHLSA